MSWQLQRALPPPWLVVFVILYFVLNLSSGCWLTCRCCVHSLSPFSSNPGLLSLLHLYCGSVPAPSPPNSGALSFHDGIFPHQSFLFKHFILIIISTAACFHFVKQLGPRSVLILRVCLSLQRRPLPFSPHFCAHHSYSVESFILLPLLRAAL